MFDEEEADFSGITGHKDLYVSDVIHQAKMEVYNVKKRKREIAMQKLQYD